MYLQYNMTIYTNDFYAERQTHYCATNVTMRNKFYVNICLKVTAICMLYNSLVYTVVVYIQSVLNNFRYRIRLKPVQFVLIYAIRMAIRVNRWQKMVFWDILYGFIVLLKFLKVFVEHLIFLQGHLHPARGVWILVPFL